MISAAVGDDKTYFTFLFYPDKGAKNNGIDGVYGPKTANAVKRFQLMNGLTAAGIYGPQTKAKLKSKVK
ncbi:N-acetylmuramoyl-L-alanine amidase [Bacillus vallismortis]|nr:N-acetylmuramoyl-L-alanine amidase [Bacillus vallismortis]